MKRNTIRLAVAVMAMMVAFAACKKEKPNNGNDDEVVSGATLTFDKNEYYPFDVVIVQLSEAATAEKYNGTLDNKPIVAMRADESVLVFAVPDLAAGEYPLSLQIGNTTIDGNLKIIALPVVQNPNVIINEMKTTFAQAVTELKQSGDPNAALLASMSSAFETQLAQLSEQDKQKLAALWTVHPEWGNLTADAALRSKSAISSAIYDFRKRLSYTVISIGAFEISLMGLPSPFATVAALASGISAVYNFSKLIPATKNLCEQVFILAKEEGLNLLQRKNTYDYTLNNGDFFSVDVYAVYRSIGAQDINGNAPDEAKTIIALINTFHREWDRVVGFVDVIRQYTPFSNNLSDRPKKVTEIDSPIKETKSVDSWTLLIVSGNVLAQKQSDNSYKITTTATEDVEFKFKIVADGMTSEVFSGLLKVEEEETCEDCVAKGGVCINGVCWATSNVDAPGTFAATPESSGMLYQWNRKKGWSATGDVIGWDPSVQDGDVWAKANDPCPAGWRVPTISELEKLVNAGSIWAGNGRIFGKGSNTILLPVAGTRNYPDGGLSNPGYGSYWSSSPSIHGIEISATELFFGSADNVNMIGGGHRREGKCVRCVSE